MHTGWMTNPVGWKCPTPQAHIKDKTWSENERWKSKMRTAGVDAPFNQRRKVPFWGISGGQTSYFGDIFSKIGAKMQRKLLLCDKLSNITQWKE